METLKNDRKDTSQRTTKPRNARISTKKVFVLMVPDANLYTISNL